MTKIRLSTLAELLFATLITLGLAAKADSAPLGVNCQILDGRDRPIYFVGIGFVEDSQFESYDKSAMIEVEGYWDFAYFRNVLRSDMTLSLVLDSTVLSDSAGLQLPDQVTAFYLDAGMTWRYLNGSALDVHLKPGIYSDWEELGDDSLHAPVSAALIHSFHPRLSGLIGMEVRTSFLTKVVPMAAVEWEMADRMRLTAGFPESRLTWNVTRHWSAHWMGQWNNMSYRVRSHSDVDHKQIEIEDFRMGLGVGYRIHDQVQFGLTLGQAFERHVEFRGQSSGLDRDIDLEDAFFWQFGIAGPF